jgi:hypothetical protein
MSFLLLFSRLRLSPGEGQHGNKAMASNTAWTA